MAYIKPERGILPKTKVWYNTDFLDFKYFLKDLWTVTSSSKLLETCLFKLEE